MLYRVAAVLNPLDVRWKLVEAPSAEVAVNVALTDLAANQDTDIHEELQEFLDQGRLVVAPAAEKDEWLNATPVLDAEDFDTPDTWDLTKVVVFEAALT